MATTFLVGVDGSDGSRRAVEFAATRARGEGARLVLLHVVDWSPYETLATQELVERHAERQREIREAQEQILEPLEKVAGAGVEIECVVQHGHAAETLIEEAGRIGADQLFIGRRGRSKVAALLFGSVAGALVQACPVPLTVVP